MLSIATERTSDAAYRFCNSACVHRNLDKFDCTMTYVDETAKTCNLFHASLDNVDDGTAIPTRKIDQEAGLEKFMLIRM